MLGWQCDVFRAVVTTNDFGLFTHKPFTRLDPQIELQLLVDAIHALVVPFKALDVT